MTRILEPMIARASVHHFSLKFFCINRLRLTFRPEMRPLKYQIVLLEYECFCAIMRPSFIFAQRRKPCASISVRHTPMGKLTPDTCCGNPGVKAKRPSKPPSSTSRPGANALAKPFASRYRIKKSWAKSASGSPIFARHSAIHAMDDSPFCDHNNRQNFCFRQCPNSHWDDTENGDLSTMIGVGVLK